MEKTIELLKKIRSLLIKMYDEDYVYYAGIDRAVEDIDEFLTNQERESKE